MTINPAWPMHILQINNFEALGGGSDRVYQLSTKMLLDRGHELATLSCGDSSFDPRKHSVLLTRNGYLERNPRRLLRNVCEFISRPASAEAVDAIVARQRPDVAHLHIFYGQISSSVLKRLRYHRIPTVMTVHEYRMLCPISTLYTPALGVCERCAGGHYLSAVQGRCNRQSLSASLLSAVEAGVRDRWFNYVDHIDRFLMVSRFCLEKHAQYLAGIAAKSSVLYNFVNSADVSVDTPKGRTLLYCGRLAQEKGVDLLCQAVAARPQLPLEIAGDGPLGDSLRQRWGGQANIRFLGKLDASGLQARLRSAWFSVAPSEWFENNPMAILESFAQGTPVVGADIGGIPELVLSGQTGLLFQASSLDALGRAIDRAIALPAAERERMGRAALRLVRERHAPDTHYEQLMQAYQVAIADHAPAPT